MLGDIVIPEANSCKYLGIILRSDLSWADQVNYMVKKAWKALHFTMHILKEGNSNTKSLAYASLVRPILEYGAAACWDPYREGQINALDWVQKKAAKFAHHRNDATLESLTQRRQLAHICALFKTYTGERAWKTIGDRLQRPCYLGRGGHVKKIRSRKQRTDIRKYSFVNRSILLWNNLPANTFGTPAVKPSNFRKTVRKIINEAK
jgi:hypothetical protein